MKHTQFDLEINISPKIHVNYWKCEEEIKGNIVIVHGMAEYSYRYNDFASFLAKNGYDVYGTDHIGHGMSVSKEENPKYGYGCWPKNGFDDSIERVKKLVDYIHSVSDKPVLIFGHSLGSFLTTGFYERYSKDVNAVVICGSAFNNLLYRGSSLITSCMKFFKSEKKRNEMSDMLNNTNIKTMNKKCKPFEDGYKTHNGWLSYDEDNVRAYDEDKELGFPCNFYFYYSMFHGQQKIWSKKALKGLKEPKPVLLIAGKDDPVGNYGKDVPKLKKFLSRRQDNVQMKLYDNAKHEILNEGKIKDVVYKDVLDFFNNNL